MLRKLSVSVLRIFLFAWRREQISQLFVLVRVCISDNGKTPNKYSSNWHIKMDVNTTAWLYFIVQWQVKLSISISLTESQPLPSTQRLSIHNYGNWRGDQISCSSCVVCVALQLAYYLNLQATKWTHCFRCKSLNRRTSLTTQYHNQEGRTVKSISLFKYQWH
jgi:hypothetical protein